MRIVVALGGNALLRHDEAPTAENQRNNVRVAATALAPLAREHGLTISHGNGPQVGLLALQGRTCKAREAYPLDILDAETEGMIGYLIEQELGNLLSDDRLCATLLTQIEVDPNDPAFVEPTKPIGPRYSETEAKQLARERGWSFAQDGEYFRRVVASPRPKRIFEMSVIELLVDRGVIVICGGGGGIPTVQLGDGRLIGVEAVIDKDLASSLLARQLRADVFLMLTDVDAVYDAWMEPQARAFRCVSTQAISKYTFATGSMAPKIEAACEFVEQTGGRAGVGLLKDAARIIAGEAGTTIAADTNGISWWP